MSTTRNKSRLNSILSILFYGTTFSVISFFISWLISRKISMDITSIMAGIGFMAIILGALTFINGNPNGMGVGGIGQIGSTQLNSQHIQYQNLEVTRMERGSTQYFKDFKKHNVFEFNGGSFAVIVYGLIIFLVSMVIKNIA